MPDVFDYLDIIRETLRQSSFGLITDIDAFRAIHTACCDLDFHGFTIGIISQKMPEKLADEADFTLRGVADVERFLKWLSQTAVELS